MNSIIILCAGKGTRMHNNKAKCLTNLIDKPFLEYILNTIKELDDFKKRICIVSYKKEDIINRFNDAFAYVYQDKLLGTGDALKCSLNMLDEEGCSLILNGDMPLIEKDIINRLYLYHQKNNNHMTILTTIKQDPFNYGRIIKDDSDNIKAIIEQANLDINSINNNEVNLGVYIIENKILKKYVNEITLNNNREYYFTDIVNILYKDNLKIDTFKINDSYKYININDLYTLSIVEDALEKDIKIKLLSNGVEIINKNMVTIGSDVIIEKGTIIYPNTIITGTTKIGENCIIGPSSDINNSIIENNVICKHSVIEDSYIKNDTTIGPFAHLRMKTMIGKNNRIGNFVEIKNSSLGNNTNSAHLTYIGDTISGERVNFGCGVITVNYDGIKKHHTIIGNDVFIGCNSNLIAPVTIGNNVFIAAGSTITSSLEDYDFSIARSRQVIKKNYAPKYKYNFDDNKN